MIKPYHAAVIILRQGSNSVLWYLLPEKVRASPFTISCQFSVFFLTTSININPFVYEKLNVWINFMTPVDIMCLYFSTDGITNRCGSFYMSLCASCFAAPLVAVRLNYKFVTKPYVFTDHFNQSNFHFCDNINGFIYFRYTILMPYIS